VISVHVKSRRRHERGETCNEVQRLEQDGFGAVFPRFLEPVARTSIVMLFESIECEWWTSNVSTNALESRSITTIDDGASVNVHAFELSI
jgi:hypothetical protein